MTGAFHLRKCHADCRGARSKKLHLLTSSSSDDDDDGDDGSAHGTPSLMQIPVSPDPSQGIPLSPSPAPGTAP